MRLCEPARLSFKLNTVVHLLSASSMGASNLVECQLTTFDRNRSRNVYYFSNIIMSKFYRSKNENSQKTASNIVNLVVLLHYLAKVANLASLPPQYARTRSRNDTPKYFIAKQNILQCGQTEFIPRVNFKCFSSSYVFSIDQERLNGTLTSISQQLHGREKNGYTGVLKKPAYRDASTQLIGQTTVVH